MKVGDQITVIDYGFGDALRPRRVTVTWVGTVGFDFQTAFDDQWGPQAKGGRFFDLDPLADEGTGWCHGWEGEAVDALLAAHALS